MGLLEQRNIAIHNQVLNYHFAHLDIIFKPNNKLYSIICIYCPAQNANKDVFSSDLINYSLQLRHSWLIVGDFN